MAHAAMIRGPEQVHDGAEVCGGIGISGLELLPQLSDVLPTADLSPHYQNKSAWLSVTAGFDVYTFTDKSPSVEILKCYARELF